MTKLLYTLLALKIIFSSCEKEEENYDSNNNNSNPSTFREIYDQTYWYSSSLNTYFKFSVNNLFYMSIPSENICVSYEEIALNNISYDACVYSQGSLSLISENSTSLSFTESISDGQSVIMGDICADANTIISFNVNSSGNIVLTMPMTDFPSNDFELLPSNQSLFSGNNCTNLWYEFTLFAAG